jgi:segregation and condensation protein A
VQARPDKLYIVFAFLCILEMVQHRVVSIVVGEGYNNFWLTPPKAEAA